MLPEWNGVYHQGVWAAWQQFCCKLELCKRQQTLFDKSKRTREFFLNRWWFEFQTAGKHAIKLRCAQTGQPLCPWWWHQWFLVDRDNANMLQLVFNKEMGLSCSRNRDYRPIYGNSWVNEWMSWIGTWFSGPAITGPLASKKGRVSHFKASNQPMASDGNLRNRCKFAQHGLPVPVPIIMTHKTTLCPQHRATQNPVFHHLPDPIIVYIFLENPQDKPILCECLIVKWCENFPSYSETSPSLSEHYHFTLW
jgi:hypothetical protein